MEEFDKNVNTNKKDDFSAAPNSRSTSLGFLSVEHSEDKHDGILVEERLNHHVNVNKSNLKAMEFHSADDIR